MPDKIPKKAVIPQDRLALKEVLDKENNLKDRTHELLKEAKHQT